MLDGATRIHIINLPFLFNNFRSFHINEIPRREPQHLFIAQINDFRVFIDVFDNLELIQLRVDGLLKLHIRHHVLVVLWCPGNKPVVLEGVYPEVVLREVALHGYY